MKKTGMNDTIVVDLSIYDGSEGLARVLRMETNEETLNLFLAGSKTSACMGGFDTEDENVSQPSSPMRDHFFVRDNYMFRRIPVQDIVVVKAARSYCEICLVGGGVITLSVPMSEIVKVLPTANFLRIHRAHTINIRFVSGLTGNTISLENGEQLPIGREYREQVFFCFVFVGTKSRKYLK